MTGWLALILLAAAVLAAMWRFARLDSATLQLVASALLLGLAGYAWQGSPGLAGSPKAAPETEALPDTAFTQMRRDMMGQFTAAERWLTIAEGRYRRGDTAGAAAAVRAGLKRNPRDVTLWIGYGNALAAHGGGMISPAAQLAFQRAAAIAPDHPAPRFFFGLSLAQAGRLDEAERLWREVMALAPPDSPWRAQAEQQLAFVAEARRMEAQPGR